MSDITLFKSGGNIPDFFKEINDFTKDVAGSSGIKSISIDGGVWRMQVGGEEIAKNEDRAMNFVVVGADAGVSRVYYDGPYVKGQASSPACFSPDSVKPDASVSNPQARTCATCPQNIEGSAPNGKKACKFFKHIAVVLEGDMSGNVYRLKLGQQSYFAGPMAGKPGMGFRAYAKFLSGHNVPMAGVVTEAKFDTSASVPVLKFSALRPLTREEFEMVRPQLDADDTLTAKQVSFASGKGGDGAAAPAPKLAAPKNETPDEPTRRPSSKSKEVQGTPKSVDDLMNEWGSDDDE